MLGEATFRNILEDFGKFWKILEEAKREGHLPSRKERFRKILEDLGKSWKILEKANLWNILGEVRKEEGNLPLRK